jgi:hypothetical protein
MAMVLRVVLDEKAKWISAEELKAEIMKSNVVKDVRFEKYLGGEKSNVVRAESFNRKF